MQDSSPSEALNELSQRQQSSWRSGKSLRVEQLVTEEERRRLGDEALFELVAAEIQLRRQVGEKPSAAEYAELFPQFQGRLARLFESECADASMASTVAPKPAGENQSFGIGPQGDKPGFNSTVNWIARGEKFPSDSRPNSSGKTTKSFSITRFGDYELLDELGRGGMGIVYKARHLKLDREVALKMILSTDVASESDVRRFFLEAESAAQLDHPGIVPVYEVGEHDGRYYLAMALVDGSSLWQIVKGSPFEPCEAARIMQQVAEAMHYAHKRGIVHRDLKPHNILLDSKRQPRVTDFGLAKRTTTQSDLTRTGDVMGTPSFMPPEQAAGRMEHVDAVSDVYSLGATLYCLLTGRPPFQAANVLETLKQVLESEPPSPRSMNLAIDRDLETITLKALEKSPLRRYQNAQEFADDLHRYLAHEPIKARSIGTLGRSYRWCRRNPVQFYSASTIITILCSALAIISYFWNAEAAAHRRSEVNKKLALQRLREARETVDTSLTGFSNALQYYPGAQAARNHVLAKAASDYERFSKQENADSDLELERGRTQYRLGGVRRQLGDTEAALTAYRTAEKIFTQLVRDQKVVFAANLELANTQIRIAMLHRELGEYASAKKFLASAILALGDLNKRYPNNNEALDSLATALENDALLLSNLSEYEPAKTSAIESVRLFSDLVLNEKQQLRYLAGRARAASLLGEILVELDHVPEALKHFRKAIDDCDDLAAAEVDNLDYFESRATYRILFASGLRRSGQWDLEEGAYKATIHDFQRLLDGRPDVPLYLQRLALTRADLANLWHIQGKNQDAEQELVKALTIYTDLTRKHPDFPDYHEQMAACRGMLGDVFADLGRLEDAQRVLQSALDTYRQLTQQIPERLAYQERLAVAHSSLARILQDVGKSNEAIQHFNTSVKGLTDLCELNKNATGMKNELAQVLGFRGDLHREQGQGHEAKNDYQKAVDLWRESSLTSTSPDVFYTWAKFLVDHSDDETVDLETAISVAQRTVKFAPKNSAFHLELGAAYFLSGRWQDAKITLDQASSLQHFDDGRLGFFLTMANGKLDDQETALRCFEQGELCRKRARPQNSRLLALRDQAMRTLRKENEDSTPETK